MKGLGLEGRGTGLEYRVWGVKDMKEIGSMIKEKDRGSC